MGYESIPGWFSWEGVYARWAKEARPGAVFVECGVFLGRSITYLCEQLGDKPATVIAVDPWVDDWQPNGDDWAAPPAERVSSLTTWGGDLKAASDAHGPPFTSAMWHLATHGQLERITVLRLDSVRASRLFAAGSVDYVWLDGNHNLDPVRADIAAWTSLVRQGGAIGGHDYSVEYPGVVQAVTEAFGPDRHSAEDRWSWEVRR